MKLSLLPLTLATFLGAQLTHAGDITGTVTLKGTPPAEKELTPIRDNADCSALYPAALPTTHFYAVSSSGALADVVVSLQGAPASSGASAAPVVLDQKGCVYSPTILAVQAGQKILVKNSDPCVHNVHTSPKDNDSKNMVQMPNGADLEFVFDKPEPFVKFQCDVHPWMFAWVTVVDSPYFALSGKDGKFSIKNVPAGKYKLQFAHRKLGTQTFDIEVKDGGASQDCSFEVK
jgi:plastocyanin